MAASHNLSSRLAESLPSDTAIRAYHLSTPPTKTSPIFSAAPGQPEETTFCESHFLGVAVPHPDSGRQIFAFAVEVLVFTTPALTTVFVSKADSTGYGSLVKLPDGHSSITRSVIEAFIDFLLAPRLSEPRVVLSLFARSQDQYLFAGSVENAEKHVLDDRQLIKWWCRVLDAVGRPHTADGAEQEISAHVVVPGLERGETKAFYPPSARHEAAHTPRWSNDYPVKLLTVDDSLPPRCLIPRLPDDPKARFLGDLDSGHVGDDGHWRTVKTLDQFWEFMSYRQECSSGRLVGFIWFTFVRLTALQGRQDDAVVSGSFATQDSQAVDLPTPADSQNQLPEHPSSMVSIGVDEIVRPQSLPPSSPPSASCIDTDPEAQHGSDQVAGIEEAVAPSGEQIQNPSRPVDVRWPVTTRGQIVTDLDTYDELIEILLQHDFTGLDTAAESTQKWTGIVKERVESGAAFGVGIMGIAKPKSISTAAATGEAATQQPTLLIGVRKKRKPEDGSSHAPVAPSASPANVLSAGLVRKKPKRDEAS